MKKYLALILSIMTILATVTGCGSKDSTEAGTKEPEAIKLDTSVTVDDLLSANNASDLSDISKFIGSVKMDIVLDLTMTVEDEASDIKANVDMTVEHDGKTLHAIVNTKAEAMGETNEDKKEMWCSAEDKIMYSIDGDTWYKTTDVTPEELLEDLVSSMNISENSETINTEDMIKDFKLELDEENNTYVLKYEVGIEDLISKVPDESIAEITGGENIDAVLELLNLPEDLKAICSMTFNADKTLRGIEIALTKAEIDITDLVGAECKINLNEIKASVNYTAAIKALTIPEDIIKNAEEEKKYEFSIN